MSRCLSFPPPGYLWNGVGGQALMELIELNREKRKDEIERNKGKKRRRRKEKRKREEDAEIEQRRHTNDGQKNVEERFENEIEEGCLNLGSCCACWICSMRKNIDLLLPCLFHLRRQLDQVLSRQPVHPIPRPAVQEKFDKTRRPSSKINAEEAENANVSGCSECGFMQIESEFREFMSNWVPPPLETLNTEVTDQEWLYNSASALRKDTNQNSNADNEQFCYPFTMLF